MKLVITIDTEEDNWANYSRMDNPVENIERLVPLQELFDRYGAKPTYLISYPVATNPRSVEILKSIHDQGKCEIGSHCHPWNTPPFEEEVCDVNSMLSNLPEALVLKKLTVLHETIRKNFALTPVSFRAGRWGFNSAVARSLCTLGYRIDTSVYPFVDWGEYHGPDFNDFPLTPYHFSPNDIATPNDRGTLFEIPATVGFLQKDFEKCQRWMRKLDLDICKKLRLKGVLSRLGLLNKMLLSPETFDSRGMIKLAERLQQLNYPCLNMFFHSTTLMAGFSPFVTSRQDEVDFVQKIEDFLMFSKSSGYESVTLAQAGNELK